MPHKFWDTYETELAVSVGKKPDDYDVRNRTPEEYARLVRLNMEKSGMAQCNHNSTTFRRLAKRLGIKYTRKALIEASLKP